MVFKKKAIKAMEAMEAMEAMGSSVINPSNDTRTSEISKKRKKSGLKPIIFGFLFRNFENMHYVYLLYH